MGSLTSPSRRRCLSMAMGVAVVGAVAPWQALSAQPNRVPDPFYAYAFDDLDGNARQMTQYLGKPLVVNFWATWCPPCVKEMPDLNALNAQYPQVAFLGLAIDNDANVRKFLEKIPVDYDILLGGKDGMRVMRELGNRQGGLPFTLVFNAKGGVAERILGQVKPQVLDAYLRDLTAS